MPTDILVSTRILSDLSAARIRRAGLQLIEAELITTEPIPFQMPDMSLFSHIAFTSSRAVSAWFHVSDTAGLIPAAISGKTLQLLASYTHIDVVSAVNARQLAQALHHSANGKILSVLHPCSNIRLPDLEQELQKFGHRYSPLPVYKTMDKPQQFSVNPAAVLFFSPSAVNVYFSENSFHPQTCYACIGSTTAASVLDQFPEAIVLIPEEPDPELLVNMTINKINENKI